MSLPYELPVGLVLSVVAAIAVPTAATAKDVVPSRTRARHYFTTQFPKVAPAALLKDQRAFVYKTKKLRVAPAKKCHRGAQQVKCTFTVVLRPRKNAPRSFGRIRCRGELWGKLRNGKMIGRVGDYTCV